MNTKSHRSLGRALFLSTLAATKPANQSGSFTDILFNLTPAYLQATIPKPGSLFGWLGASKGFNRGD
ncbi:hypothetical protein H6F93_02270 [Leptolyngbya sp. FACHB-671]|uniref:hypothetical protein n=1 Tax=Leptolyngbya sp. FACHB-671 TaxID=2692812 RepID=UPI001683D0B4|nr:hypothetical protein [Leptolyngbya sp. FACHB-671]MBD2066361.1 hypothetical protein [Leptolyngbya sp. FACHB-671]